MPPTTLNSEEPVNRHSPSKHRRAILTTKHPRMTHNQPPTKISTTQHYLYGSSELSVGDRVLSGGCG